MTIIALPWENRNTESEGFSIALLCFQTGSEDFGLGSKILFFYFIATKTFLESLPCLFLDLGYL